MIKLADIRNYAMALPDVELLAHIQHGDTHTIVCVGQEESKVAAADEPDVFEEVWRNNGGIFVGARVDLAKVTKKRIQELIEQAWRHRAPKSLQTQYDNR